jgi:DNA-binding XRE family transcriptional regulator
MDAPQKLKVWRTAAERDLTFKAAGDLVGVAHSTWSEWEGGSRRPGLALAIELERVTGGAVRLEDWGHSGNVLRSVREITRTRRTGTEG